MALHYALRLPCEESVQVKELRRTISEEILPEERVSIVYEVDIPIKIVKAAKEFGLQPS